jgi:hypothetical protein
MLAQKRPSPLTRGKPQVWACAVVRVIGWVNFLDGGSQEPHMPLTAIDKAFEVAESTGQGKAKAIRDLLRIRQFDFRWMLRQRIETTSMAWMIEVNGLPMDARNLRRELQEEAFQKGLIPYIPARSPSKARRERSRTMAKSPFTGRWRIVSMSAWDEDYINEEE